MLLKMFLVGFDDAEAKGKRTVIFAASRKQMEANCKLAQQSEAVDDFRIIRELNPNGFTLNDTPNFRVPIPPPKNEFDEPDIPDGS